MARDATATVEPRRSHAMPHAFYYLRRLACEEEAAYQAMVGFLRRVSRRPEAC